MSDPRVARLARVIVDHSTAVGAGDVVLISASGQECLPLLREVHRLCLLRGAKYVQVDFTFPEIAEDFIRFGSREQLSLLPRHRLGFLRQVTVTIGIRAVANSMALAGASQEKKLMREKTLRPLLERRVNHTRWVVCRYPTQGFAQEAGMSLEELENFFFRACTLDWEKESRRQEALVRRMTEADRVHIEAEGTDLSFRLVDKEAVKADGRRNLPDGEVYTAPRRDSLEGVITFNCPTIHDGRPFDDIRLEFSRGKAVRATCRQGRRELNRILDVDEGGRYVGEFAFGVNRRIRRPIRTILFDEKMFGSLHLAMGNSYRRCYNGNRSAIHWDLVLMLGRKGRVTFDGRPVFEGGRFQGRDLAPLNPR